MQSTLKNKAGFPALSFCRACGEDFNGDSLFDSHRRGDPAFDWSPEQEDGRRCLGTDELEAKGWELNARGRWSDASRVHPRAR